MKKFLINLINEAGNILREAFYTKNSLVNHKGNIDLVTDTDLKLENFITSQIKKRYPDDLIIAEEKYSLIKNAKRIWIIDPLDGTTNFVHRFPFVNISIALEIDNEIRFGAVYNPIFNELFFAEKHHGAFLNGSKITVSNNNEISNCIVATGFPYDRWEKGDYYIKEFLAFTKTTQGVRRTGSAAIDLCYVAAGRFDGFFERKLKPWDMAAGSLIVSEAGGKITKFNGNSWHYTNDTIIASNGRIHNKMVNILANAHKGNIK